MACYCPKCHAQNADTTNFCSVCGEQVAAGARLRPVSKSCDLAVASLTLGIVSVPGYCFAPGFGVVAAILGFMARSRIRRSGGHLTGSGLALAGIILGVFGTTVQLVGGTAGFVEAQARARVARAKTELRTLAPMLDAYRADYGTYPQTLDLLPPREGPNPGVPLDVFAPKTGPAPLCYAPFNPRTEDGQTIYDAFIVVSRGPDRVFQTVPESLLESLVPWTGDEVWNRLQSRCYDPTNGTLSEGDIFIVGGNATRPEKQEGGRIP